MTISRLPHAARAVTTLLAALAGTLLVPAPAQAAGPVSATDRDFVAQAHNTATFAVAASELAETSGAGTQIQTIGRKVLEQDRQLADRVRTAATRLQIVLPTPTGTDLATLETSSGEDFAAAYIDRLRTSDGSLLELAVTVRVHTRNDVIRDLAHRTASTMMAQLPLLESSGMVDFMALPAQTLATARAAARPGPNADPEMLSQARSGDGFLWPRWPVALLVLALALLIAWSTWRRITNPPRHRRH
ncbi:DUF4142 domain-containing protein [Paractinoplanes rishiriensis]|uniref:DUF4142 domain-containing protein n=1 Tax=Paractinoplanes rishiriensis TaxID=1050105 RepID=A0A919JXP3_9ACTN|nr:DUF4142 domain-containing protein [Actinoplanes rishiriensis]GIE95417.1 hypothetical protein Ari01nite_28820 [Actinoplanes rishiriensis]